jgi:hypothetical protein
VDDESKQRAAQYLKQVSELSKSATKTAFVSLAALAIIWITQIRPQYNQLLNYVYPAFHDLKQDKKKLRDYKRTLRELKPTARVSLVESLKENTGDKKINNSAELKKEVDKKNKAINIKRNELESIIKSISFDVFGLKAPVTPLFAAVVWSIVLFVVLLYLARARSSIWSLCADALFILKRLGKTSAFDDIAGVGPLWLAPPPSRPASRPASPPDKTEVTTQELRSAFGWSRSWHRW